MSTEFTSREPFIGRSPVTPSAGMLSDAFADTVEVLLAGELICEFAWPDCHDYLKVESHREAVNAYLLRIRRVLRATNDEVAWYAASTAPERVDGALRRQFREVIQQLEPLTRWLALVMSAESTDMPLSPGERLKEGQLLSRIEDSVPLADELAHLVRLPLFQSVQRSAKGQLGYVLKTLTKLGYLHHSSETSSIYTVTGKWSYLYEVMEFIACHEQLDKEPDPETTELDLQ